MKKEYEKLLKAAKPYLGVRNNWLHTKISVRYAFELLKKEKGDESVVIPAIILHDIGWSKVPKEILEKWKKGVSKKMSVSPRIQSVHEDIGADIARKILTKQEYLKDKIDHICKIVKNHDTKRIFSKEDRIVRDADRLWRYTKEASKMAIKKLGMKYPTTLKYLRKKMRGWFKTKTGLKIAKKELAEREKKFKYPQTRRGCSRG